MLILRKKYDNIKQNILITTNLQKSIRDKIIVEFSNINGNWTASMPTEDDFIEMSKTRSLIEQNGKYYLSLDDHSSTNYLEIDQITYENLLRFSDVETKKSIN